MRCCEHRSRPSILWKALFANETSFHCQFPGIGHHLLRFCCTPWANGTLAASEARTAGGMVYMVWGVGRCWQFASSISCTQASVISTSLEFVGINRGRQGPLTSDCLKPEVLHIVGSTSITSNQRILCLPQTRGFAHHLLNRLQ